MGLHGSCQTAPRACLPVHELHQVHEARHAQAPCWDSQELQRVMKPLSQAATALPPMAMRADPFVAVTALARYLPSLVQACYALLPAHPVFRQR